MASGEEQPLGPQPGEVESSPPAPASAPSTTAEPVDSGGPGTALAVVTRDRGPLMVDRLASITRQRFYGRRRYDLARYIIAILGALSGIAVTFYLLGKLSWALLPCMLVLILAYLIQPISTTFQRLLRVRFMSVGMTLLTLGLFAFLAGWKGLPLMGRELHSFVDSFHEAWVEVQETVPKNAFVPRRDPIREEVPSARFTTVIEFFSPIRLLSPDDPRERPHDPDYYPPRYSTNDSVRKEEIRRYLLTRSASGVPEVLGVWNEYLRTPTMKREDAISEFYDLSAGTYMGTVFDELTGFINERGWNPTINSIVDEIFPNGTTALVLIVLGSLLIGFMLVLVLHLVIAIQESLVAGGVWQTLLLRSKRPLSVRWTMAFCSAMDQFLVRQSVGSLGVAILAIGGFTYLGLPIPITLGLLIGLLSMVPYLHLTGIGPAAVIALFHAYYQRLPLTPLLLGILAVFLVIQLYLELVSKPWIVGRASWLERIALLFGVFFWPLLMGLPGLAFVIPGTCALLAWYRLSSPGKATAVHVTPPSRPIQSPSPAVERSPTFSPAAVIVNASQSDVPLG